MGGIFTYFLDYLANVVPNVLKTTICPVLPMNRQKYPGKSMIFDQNEGFGCKSVSDKAAKKRAKVLQNDTSGVSFCTNCIILQQGNHGRA